MTRLRLFLLLLPALVATPSPAHADQVTTPDSVRKYRFLGKTARDKDDDEGAVRYYRRLLQFRPRDHHAYYYIGRAEMALGDAQKAKEAFLAADRIDSTHANTNLLLYQLYTQEADPDSAWVFLSRLAGQRNAGEKYLNYRRAVADLYRRQGQVDKAIEHYTALVGAPKLPEADREQLYELLAVLSTDAGNVAQALAWRRRQASEDDGSHVETLAQMVDLQIETKDYQGAYGTLKTLARTDSAGRYSHYHRMAALGERIGDARMRLAGLQGMARTQPNDLETVATLVEIQLNDGKLVAAGRWLERGLAVDREDAHLNLLRGDLLRTSDAPDDDVIVAYETALKDPNWASVAQQRIWQIRPPETQEEKLKKAFFGGGADGDAKDGGS